MAQVRSLKIQSRERTGTGGARATRRQGLIPGVVYGGKDKPASIAIETRELEKAMTGGRFTSSLFEVELSGAKTRVVPRAVQFDPVTDRPVHFDLFRLETGSKVSLFIPVTFVNHEASPGLKRGGVLNIVRHEVELTCPVDNIPSEIIGDLTGLGMTDSLHISAFKLPEGVNPAIQGRDFTVATISPPAVMTDEGPAEGEGAEGAAAAPAAGAKAPAAGAKAPAAGAKAAPAAAAPAKKK
ncbi:MAG: 50S ribosomal protein L25/general stress protein Ctc [Alphaproteobacteria bacterium]|nr:50S ribosomal protein L25/general stress protein Ctc [Alphaproteobacteria bacterium]